MLTTIYKCKWNTFEEKTSSKFCLTNARWGPAHWWSLTTPASSRWPFLRHKLAGTVTPHKCLTQQKCWHQHFFSATVTPHKCLTQQKCWHHHFFSATVTPHQCLTQQKCWHQHFISAKQPLNKHLNLDHYTNSQFSRNSHTQKNHHTKRPCLLNKNCITQTER